MSHSIGFTLDACRQRKRLLPELIERIDDLILGVGLSPTIGCFDERTGLWTVHLGNELRVLYQIAWFEERIVVVHIGPQLHRYVEQAERYACGAVGV